MRSSHTTEYYSALKKESLSHARMWKNLEDVMLSEISQSQEDTYCMVLVIEVGRVVRFTETEGGWWSQGLWRGSR